MRDYVRAPGFGEIMVYNWQVDNSGPPANSSVVQGTFEQLQQMFPGAEVVSSTIDEFATNLLQFLGSANNTNVLPTLNQEMGDSWLYGGASDPLKIMRYRSAARLAGLCIASGGCSVSDPVFGNFSRLLVKAFEHTFGSSGNLAGEQKWANLPNSEYHAAIAAGGYQYAPFAALVNTWNVQRDISVNFPLEALPEGGSDNDAISGGAGAVATAATPIRALAPASPSALRVAIEADWDAQREAAFPPTSPGAQGFEKLSDPTQTVAGLGGWLTLAFNATNSAATLAVDGRTGEHWASPENPLGLYEYQ